MKRFRKIGWIVILFCASIWGAPYTDNGNGAVRDLGKGLIWQKCSAGLGTTLGNCNTGSATTYTWSNAISYCEGLTLGGRTDWRLPNVNELRSIVNYTSSSELTINSTAFPNTQPNGYWSSSTYAQSTVNAWYVGFNGGGVGRDSKANGYFVRCVTGP
jgi:hypothetical protein